MADEIKVNKIAEPQNWSWYNSERREAEGAHYSNIKRCYEGAGANIQTFLFDGTGTDVDHTKTTTLMTLANGVRVDYEWYAEEISHGTPPRYGYRVIGDYHIYGKDGSEIFSSGHAEIESDIRESTSLSNIRLHYIPSFIQYDENGMLPQTGHVGADIKPFGMLVGQTIYGAIDPPPSLNGEIKYADWATRYSKSTIGPTYYNWDEMADFLQDVDDAGDGTPFTKEKPDDDTSKPDPGDPDYDPTSDPVPHPELPENDAISTGFVHVYCPNMTELRAIAGKLWADDFINTIKKVQNDPMEAVISLHHIPFNPRYGSEECVIGNYNSGISVGSVLGQWYKRHLGQLTIPEHWASALDYAPYTQIDCFIPFLGIRSFQVDDIIGKRIDIEMNVDIISGAAIVHVKCGDSVLYTYNTSISGQVPISQSSYAPLYNAIVSAIGNVASGYGAAGAAGAGVAAAGSALSIAMGKQHSINRSGSIGGSTGCMGILTPYLIIHRPLQSLASGYNHFKGRPSNISTNLSSISGYTEIESIHLDGIACTENERSEIRALLYNGVIF